MPHNPFQSQSIIFQFTYASKLIEHTIMYYHNIYFEASETYDNKIA